MADSDERALCISGDCPLPTRIDLSRVAFVMEITGERKCVCACVRARVLRAKTLYKTLDKINIDHLV